MMTIPLKLERQLNFERDGKHFFGALCIDRLEQLEPRKWACFWSCDYLAENGHIYGEDALYALTSCLKLIRGLIQDAAKDGLIIWWQYRGDNCWFE